MDNPVTWAVLGAFFAGYLVIRVLDQVLGELKQIRILLAEIEKRGQPPIPTTIEEWQAQRNTR